MIFGRLFEFFCIFLSITFVLTNFSNFFMQKYVELYPWFAWLCVLGEGKSEGQVAKIHEKIAKF